jgi:hypothetical protein
MKINVTVDLEDFFSEDENSFNEQILNHIEWQVKTQVWNEFKTIALDRFKEKINSEINESKEQEMDRIIHKIFTEKKIKVREATKGNPEPEMVTLFEYIEDKVNKDYFNANNTADSILNRKLHEKQIQFEKMIEVASEKIGSEIKDRYDLLFASQIVSNLNKNGMLKEDIAKILLENNGNQS